MLVHRGVRASYVVMVLFERTKVIVTNYTTINHLFVINLALTGTTVQYHLVTMKKCALQMINYLSSINYLCSDCRDNNTQGFLNSEFLVNNTVIVKYCDNSLNNQCHECLWYPQRYVPHDRATLRILPRIFTEVYLARPLTTKKKCGTHEGIM